MLFNIILQEVRDFKINAIGEERIVVAPSHTPQALIEGISATRKDATV